MFRKNGKQNNYATGGRNITITANSICIFDGPVEDIPIDDEVMIKKSIELYNDPEPCYIHRGAVRQAIVRELGELFSEGEKKNHEKGVKKIREYMACDEITDVILQ